MTMASDRKTVVTAIKAAALVSGLMKLDTCPGGGGTTAAFGSGANDDPRGMPWGDPIIDGAAPGGPRPEGIAPEGIAPDGIAPDGISPTRSPILTRSLQD